MVGDGYAGCLLEVDLTEQRVCRRPLPDSYRRLGLGGKALAAQLLWDSMTGTETAFSEDNLMVVTAAPLTGTGAPGANRFDVASLSPKDDLPSFSNCGGVFGAYLKKAGCDGLILRGKAPTPQWLEISGQQVRFHDARDLWGLGTGMCQEQLVEIHRQKSFAALGIGPAGENLVKFASLVSEGHSTGRAGLGAVLGWKNLKAVTVSGEAEMPVWDRAAAAQENRQWYAWLRNLRQQPAGEGYCRDCPLQCPRHRRNAEPLLNELGMDAIGAEAALAWAADQGMGAEQIYEAIAFRRGIGSRLAEGVENTKDKGGKRRSGSYGQIAKAFGLSPEADETGDFCRNFTEAVSACGQCMFTVNALQPGMEQLPLLQLLESVTGRHWDLSGLLALGRYSRTLEEQLKKRFQK